MAAVNVPPAGERHAGSLRALGQALTDLGVEYPLRLPAGCEVRVVTAAQSALLDFLAQHPYCTIETLEVHAGDPDLVRLRLTEAAVMKIKLSGTGQHTT